jgi:hypothetical protein
MAFGRTFLYHKTYPQGRIFSQEDEYLTCLRDGWVEAPWLVDYPFPVEAPSETSQEAKTDELRETTQVERKKPGRRSKKSQGGK